MVNTLLLMSFPPLLSLLILIGATFLPLPAIAQQNYELSGFASATLGKVTGKTKPTDNPSGYACPCFWSDYGQGSVYESSGLQFKPQSKVAAQLRVFTNDQKFYLTGQVISRAVNNGKVNLEWLYMSAELNSSLTVQAGKQRLPLLQFSDVQDVGYSLPWTHLPPQLYGWETVNYQGANLRWRPELAEVQVATNWFLGNNRTNDTPYFRANFGKNSITDTRWGQIRGLEAKISYAGVSARLMALNTRAQYEYDRNSSTLTNPLPIRVRTMGISVDKNNWFSGVEYLNMAHINGGDKNTTDHAFLIHTGYRYGKFTPVISYSSYRQKSANPSEPAESSNTAAVALRYDYSNTSSFKFQLDRWRDTSPEDLKSFHGNSRLLSFSYEFIF
jgi:hypothetical protein